MANMLLLLLLLLQSFYLLCCAVLTATFLCFYCADVCSCNHVSARTHAPKHLVHVENSIKLHILYVSTRSPCVQNNALLRMDVLSFSISFFSFFLQLFFGVAIRNSFALKRLNSIEFNQIKLMWTPQIFADTETHKCKQQINAKNSTDKSRYAPILKRIAQFIQKSHKRSCIDPT